MNYQINYQNIKDFYKFMGLIFILIFLSCASSKLKLNKSLLRGQLSNGLKYFIYKNQIPKNTVSMGIVFNVGSLNEADNERGLAHYLEHMAFNGTRDYPGNSLIEVLKKFGMQFGADINATTSFNFTFYKLDLTKGNNKEEISEAFNILRNWAFQVDFTEEEVNKERNIIIEEKKLGDRYPKRMNKKLYEFLFKGSRYEIRFPIGLEEQILSFKSEDFKKFYEKWYRPDLANIVVVGDIDPKEIEGKINKEFSYWAKPDSILENVKVNLDTKLKEKFLLLEDVEQNVPSLMFIKKEVKNPFRIYKDIWNYVNKSLLNRLFENRFYELKIGGVHHFKNVKTTSFALIKSDKDIIDTRAILVNFNPDSLEEGVEDFFYELERIKKFGFTLGEFEKIRDQMLKGSELKMKNIGSVDSLHIFNELIDIAVNNSQLIDSEEFWTLIIQYLKNIDLNTILSFLNQEFNKNFDINNYVVIYSYSGKIHSVLTLKNIDDIRFKVLKKDIEPYKDSLVQGKFFKKSLDSKNIIEESGFEDEISSFTLENGVEVYFKHSDYQRGKIDFSAKSWGGLLEEDPKFASVLIYAPKIVLNSGYGDYSALQFEKYLSEKAVSLFVGVGEQESYINGSSDTKSLETLFELIYFLFNEPKVDEVVLQNFINDIKTLIRSKDNDLDYSFERAISKFINNNDPRLRDVEESDLKYLTKGNILSFYKKRFTYANNFKFVFVGDSTLEKIKNLSKRYLGNLDSKKIDEYKDLDYSYSKNFGRIVVEKGNNSTAFACLIYPFKFNYTYEVSLNLNALADLLTDGLFKNIREKMSNVYRIRSSFDPNLRKNSDSDGILFIFFTADPKNLDSVFRNINNYMSDRQKVDFTDDDFFYIKKNYIKNTKINLESNYYWISNILNSVIWNGSFKNNFGVKFIESSLDKNSINQLFRKINLNERAEIVLIPKKIK